MRIGRLRITLEWLRRKPPSPFTRAPLALEDFAEYPDNSLVRNQRTGENVLVRPPQRPDQIVRGVGSVGPLPTLPDDEWVLIKQIMVLVA